MARKRRHEIIARAYNRKGHLLSIGKNSYVRTHPLQANYGKRTGRPKAIFLHAEVAALLKAREPVYRMEIIRLNAKGESVLAKPCDACALALKEFNVQEIVYSM